MGDTIDFTSRQIEIVKQALMAAYHKGASDQEKYDMHMKSWSAGDADKGVNSILNKYFKLKADSNWEKLTSEEKDHVFEKIMKDNNQQ